MQHLSNDPEMPKDDILPTYAKLFFAVLGLPILDPVAPDTLQGVLLLYLPYKDCDEDVLSTLASQAEKAGQYLNPSTNPNLAGFLQHANSVLAAISYKRRHEAAMLKWAGSEVRSANSTVLKYLTLGTKISNLYKQVSWLRPRL